VSVLRQLCTVSKHPNGLSWFLLFSVSITTEDSYFVLHGELDPPQNSRPPLKIGSWTSKSFA